MSTLEVGKIVPATGTAITLGDSGDTFTVPSGGALTVASGATINITGATQTGFPGGLFSGYAVFADQKAQNTTGGAFTSGAWRQRDLNTTLANTDTTNITLGTNDFTLLAGNYFIQWSAPAHACNYNQTQLHDGTSTIAVGNSNYSGTSTPGTGVARVTPGTSTTYQIQHQCGTTSSNGFGVEDNYAVEQYTTVLICKES
jgi:hypothetical protein